MKRTNNIKEIGYIIIAMSIIIIIYLILASTVLKHYSREAYVENNNGVEIVFTDVRGHMWGWIAETIEETKLKEGEKVILTFDDNGTENFVEDDILIQVIKK